MKPLQCEPSKEVRRGYENDAEEAITNWAVFRSQLRNLKTALAELEPFIASQSQSACGPDASRHRLIYTKLAECEHLLFQIDKLKHVRTELSERNEIVGPRNPPSSQLSGCLHAIKKDRSAEDTEFRLPCFRRETACNATSDNSETASTTTATVTDNVVRPSDGSCGASSSSPSVSTAQPQRTASNMCDTTTKNKELAGCSYMKTQCPDELSLTELWDTAKSHAAALHSQLCAPADGQTTPQSVYTPDLLLLRAWRMQLVNAEWLVQLGLERVQRREEQLKEIEIEVIHSIHNHDATRLLHLITGDGRDPQEFKSLPAALISAALSRGPPPKKIDNDTRVSSNSRSEPCVTSSSEALEKTAGSDTAKTERMLSDQTNNATPMNTLHSDDIQSSALVLQVENRETGSSTEATNCFLPSTLGSRAANRETESSMEAAQISSSSALVPSVENGDTESSTEAKDCVSPSSLVLRAVNGETESSTETVPTLSSSALVPHIKNGETESSTEQTDCLSSATLVLRAENEETESSTEEMRCFSSSTVVPRARSGDTESSTEGVTDSFSSSTLVSLPVENEETEPSTEAALVLSSSSFVPPMGNGEIISSTEATQSFSCQRELSPIQCISCRTVAISIPPYHEVSLTVQQQQNIFRPGKENFLEKNAEPVLVGATPEQQKVDQNVQTSPPFCDTDHISVHSTTPEPNHPENTSEKLYNNCSTVRAMKSPNVVPRSSDSYVHDSPAIVLPAHTTSNMETPLSSEGIDGANGIQGKPSSNVKEPLEVGSPRESAAAGVLEAFPGRCGCTVNGVNFVVAQSLPTVCSMQSVVGVPQKTLVQRTTSNRKVTEGLSCARDGGDANEKTCESTKLGHSECGTPVVLSYGQSSSASEGSGAATNHSEASYVPDTVLPRRPHLRMVNKIRQKKTYPIHSQQDVDSGEVQEPSDCFSSLVYRTTVALPHVSPMVFFPSHKSTVEARESTQMCHNKAVKKEKSRERVERVPQISAAVGVAHSTLEQEPSRPRLPLDFCENDNKEPYIDSKVAVALEANNINTLLAAHRAARKKAMSFMSVEDSVIPQDGIKSTAHVQQSDTPRLHCSKQENPGLRSSKLQSVGFSNKRMSSTNTPDVETSVVEQSTETSVAEVPSTETSVAKMLSSETPTSEVSNAEVNSVETHQSSDLDSRSRVLLKSSGRCPSWLSLLLCCDDEKLNSAVRTGLKRLVQVSRLCDPDVVDPVMEGCVALMGSSCGQKVRTACRCLRLVGRCLSTAQKTPQNKGSVVSNMGKSHRVQAHGQGVSVYLTLRSSAPSSCRVRVSTRCRVFSESKGHMKAVPA